MNHLESTLAAPSLSYLHSKNENELFQSSILPLQRPTVLSAVLYLCHRKGENKTFQKKGGDKPRRLKIKPTIKTGANNTTDTTKQDAIMNSQKQGSQSQTKQGDDLPSERKTMNPLRPKREKVIP